MQSRTHSLIEACANTASGFLVSLAAAHAVFPAFGCHITTAQNIGITLIFTVLSIARSYVWRRIFNGKETRDTIGSAHTGRAR
jgi:SNF family Na+-dependent transporter